MEEEQAVHIDPEQNPDSNSRKRKSNTQKVKSTMPQTNKKIEKVGKRSQKPIYIRRTEKRLTVQIQKEDTNCLCSLSNHLKTTNSISVYRNLQKNFPFFSLPPKIRLQIYSLFYSHPPEISVWLDKRSGWPIYGLMVNIDRDSPHWYPKQRYFCARMKDCPSLEQLMFANRQFHEEARRVLYGNRFRFEERFVFSLF